MTANRRTLANSRATTFVGGKTGSMLVASHATISGQPIARVDAVDMIAGIPTDLPLDAIWAVHGVASNDRYTTRAEKTELTSRQAPIGRPEATSLGTDPIAQEGRMVGAHPGRPPPRSSKRTHIISRLDMRYLPAVARRLLHCQGPRRRSGAVRLYRLPRFLHLRSEAAVRRHVGPAAGNQGMVLHGSRNRHSPSQEPVNEQAVLFCRFRSPCSVHPEKYVPSII